VIYKMKSHSVQAQLIKALSPLRASSDRVLSPDAGLILELEDGKRIKWMAEPNVPMPTVGDYFAEDNELHTTAVITAAKFSELFETV